MCSLCFQRRNRRTKKIINLKPLEPRRPSLRERERERGKKSAEFCRENDRKLWFQNEYYTKNE